MNETKFPHRQDGAHFWDCYDPDEVENWFKQCMRDFKTKEQILKARPSDWEWQGQYVMEVERWFKKWFSQFIEKGERE